MDGEMGRELGRMDGWMDGTGMKGCVDGWNRGRKGVADRRADRRVGQKVVGVPQLPQLSLAGHRCGAVRHCSQEQPQGRSCEHAAVLPWYRGCSHGTAHPGDHSPAAAGADVRALQLCPRPHHDRSPWSCLHVTAVHRLTLTGVPSGVPSPQDHQRRCPWSHPHATAMYVAFL